MSWHKEALRVLIQRMRTRCEVLLPCFVSLWLYGILQRNAALKPIPIFLFGPLFFINYIYINALPVLRKDIKHSQDHPEVSVNHFNMGQSESRPVLAPGTSIDDLPPEIIGGIAQYLGPDDLHSFH